MDSRPIKDWTEFAADVDGDWPGFPLDLGDTSTTSAGRVITVELLNAQQTEAFDTAPQPGGRAVQRR